MLLVAVVCLGVAVSAQNVCKISGSNDNVEIFNSYIDVANNKLVVTVGNDSNDISANVTITADVTVVSCPTCSSLKKITISGKEIAKPNQTTSITIPLSNPYIFTNNSEIKDVKISGTKCL